MRAEIRCVRDLRVAFFFAFGVAQSFFLQSVLCFCLGECWYVSAAASRQKLSVSRVSQAG